MLLEEGHSFVTPRLVTGQIPLIPYTAVHFFQFFISPRFKGQLNVLFVGYCLQNSCLFDLSFPFLYIFSCSFFPSFVFFFNPPRHQIAQRHSVSMEKDDLNFSEVKCLRHRNSIVFNSVSGTRFRGNSNFFPPNFGLFFYLFVLFIFIWKLQLKWWCSYGEITVSAGEQGITVLYCVYVVWSRDSFFSLSLS